MGSIIWFAAKAIVAYLAMALVLSLLSAVVVQLCWNAAVVQIFSLPTITFVQAFCLCLLANLLIRSSGNSTNKGGDD